MTEEQIKCLCKWAVEKRNQPLTDYEKEILKRAIDSSKNWGELFMVAFLSRMIQNENEWKPHTN